MRLVGIMRDNMETLHVGDFYGISEQESRATHHNPFLSLRSERVGYDAGMLHIAQGRVLLNSNCRVINRCEYDIL